MIQENGRRLGSAGHSSNCVNDEMLERDSPTQLPEPRLMRAGRSSEAPIREVRIHVGVVGAVEQIKEFEPDLEVYAFRDCSVFVDVGIRLKEIRSTELHGFFVSFLSKSGDSEVGLRDGSCQPRLVV